MDVVIVAKRVAFSIPGPVNAFDYGVYHGISVGDGCRIFVPRSTLPKPLRVIRPGNRIPDVFSPQVNFVVSESIRDKCCRQFAIDSLQVVFEKLVTLERGANKTRPEVPETLWKKLADNADYHERIGKYYELLALPASVFGTLCPGSLAASRSYKVNMTFQDTVSLSRALFEVYPLILTKAGIVMPMHVLELLSIGIDWDYYEYKSVAMVD